MSLFKVGIRITKNAAIGSIAGAAGGYASANVGFKKEGAKSGAVIGGVVGGVTGIPLSAYTGAARTFARGLKATPSSKVGAFFRKVDKASAAASSGARKVSGAAKEAYGKVKFIRVRVRIIPVRSKGVILRNG